MKHALLLLLPLALLACDDASDPAQVPPGRDAGEATACRLNSDCPPGLYCKDRVCAFDCRVSRDCADGELCESGECVAPPCSRDDACNPPATVCEAGRCVAGCQAGGCEEGERCGPSTGRCGPTDCRQDGCPDGAACDPRSGDCVALCEPACPAGQTCEAGACAGASCVVDGCGAGEECDTQTGRCEPEGFDCRTAGCPEDQDCNTVTGRCVDRAPDCRRDGCAGGLVCDEGSGACVQPPADCRDDGCPGGQVCNMATGVCQAEDLERPIGAPCDRAFQCESKVCVGAQQGFCTRTCCAETDCPQGFGCIYQGGVSFCVPPGLVANNDFSAGSGQACGAGFNNCRTGLCLQGRCAAACCTDGDCPAACVWIPTAGGEVRAICDLPNVLGGPGGSGCYGDLDCENRVCIFNPNAPQGAPPGLCAGWCCRNADCGPGLGCGQVEGPGQVIT
ncbi:MAG: hypothetical protein KC549_16690, partial [Myxococcales bacterium]|nr:hypothetical protein [Myxococcales bacterium]